MIRRFLLWASRNPWLARTLPRLTGVRRAVARFVPGEELDDAVYACRDFEVRGVSTVLTLLGEHVSDPGEARGVRDHYLDVLDRCDSDGLPTEISVKLTQLGLEVDPALALDHLNALVERAEANGRRVWVDMEESEHVAVTLDVYRRALERSSAVAVCLQAYLYRTPDDVEDVLERGGTVRLVKGAYDEPADVAFPDRADVDDAFRRLAGRLLDDDALRGGRRHAFATHDEALIRHVRAEARQREVPQDAFEIQTLYGIRRDLQRRLAGEDASLRVLISYGPAWFPWYMRRLAERPANIWLLLRSLVSG